MPFLRSKLTLIFSAGLLAVFSALIAKTYLRERTMAREVRRLEASITDTEAKNQELTKLIDYFSKPEYLEKEARIRLNLKKPDEEVLVLPQETARSTPPPSPVEKKQRSPADMLANFFKSLFSKKVIEVK